MFYDKKVILEEKIEKNNQAANLITLEIFAGKNIAPKKLVKLQALKSDHILVSIQDRPLQTLFNKIKDPGVRSLRQTGEGGGQNRRFGDRAAESAGEF